MKHKLLCLNLRLFDGEAAAPVTAGEANVGEATPPSVAKKGKPGNELANVVYGKQAIEQQADSVQSEEATTEPVTKTPEERKAEFTRLLNEEYKDLDTERMQSIIDKRFKETKTLQSQIETVSPLIEMLASRYGVDSSDYEALTQAIEEDSALYEEEALERGLTVEQLKEMKKMERENNQLRKVFEAKQAEEEANMIYSKWLEQGETLKQTFPTFDLSNEVQNSDFVKLLQNGVDMETAYKVLHQDEILGGAMQYTAQQVQQKVVNNIKARASRPSENGIQSAGAVVTKTDVKSLSKKDRAEINKRVLRGEHITF